MANQKKTDLVGLDAILQNLGSYGKFNLYNFALLALPVYLAGVFVSIYLFEALDIDYRCDVPECGNQTESTWLQYAIPVDHGVQSKCERFKTKYTFPAGQECDEDTFTNEREKCTSFVYFNDSAVRDFDLGCQPMKRTLIGSIHNAGLFVSLPLTGFISDKYGRKVALAFASLMNGTFGLLRSFSPNYVFMLIFEFLETGLGAGAYSTAFVLAVELVGPKGRVFVNTLANVFHNCGGITVATLAWWLQDWRTLLRIVFTPALFVISYLWLLDESVRWLLSKGKTDEAFRILRKAARMNNVELEGHALEPLRKDEPDKQNEKLNEDDLKIVKEPASFTDVLKSKIILKRLLCCSFLWITCTFVFYGLSINSVSLYGNKYVNFMLSVSVETPANLTCLAVLDRLGRRKTLTPSFIISGILCITIAFIPKDYTTLSLVLFLGGKFFITLSYSSVYIYVSEVFPTSARQSLLAFCSTFGRIGSSLAPLTPLMAIYYEHLPSIFFGMIAIVASFVVLLLPETLNVPLPDTIEEAENMSRPKPSKESE